MLAATGLGAEERNLIAGLNASRLFGMENR
jgi:hypothetical protein